MGVTIAAVNPALSVERLQWDTPCMGAQFIRFADVAAFNLVAGVEGRPLFGEGAMVNLIEFDAGATVPAHSHPHEQLGVVLRGMQALVVDGVAHELGPMEAYVLPGHVEHSAYCGPEGATVIDVFAPVREDYREQWAGLSAAGK
jgi:quercetin dioxygenase-like cupin family protein